MASTWAAKASAATEDRRWRVPLAFGDAISSVTAVGTSVTASDTGFYGEEAIVTLTGGSAGTEATVLVTVVTTAGLTFSETFYIAILASTKLRSNTVQDVLAFALRRIEGDGETPEASRADTAIELLNEMLAHWRISGTDTGITGDLISSDTLNIPDDMLPAIKWNLRAQVHGHYEQALSAFDAQMAEDTRRALTAKLYRPRDLNMPATLANNPNAVAQLF